MSSKTEVIMKNENLYPYEITVVLSGHTGNFDHCENDGTYTFRPRGNARTSEQSAIQAVRRTASLCGCRVERIVKIERRAES